MPVLINLHEPPSVAVEIDNIAMSMSDISSELKIVIVGDGAVRNIHLINEILNNIWYWLMKITIQVGKTCFCTVFAKKEFPSDYIPTVFETHPIKMKLYEKVCFLQ